MKKILAAVALTAIIGSFAFAKNIGLDIAIGAAYGFNSFSNTEDDRTITDSSNTIGAKADFSYEIKNNFGIQLDTSFLFPIGDVKEEIKNDGDTDSDDIDISGGFFMNFLLGPTYTFKINDNFDVKVGFGFDMLYNSIQKTVEEIEILGFKSPETTYTRSYWHYGVAATADAAYMLNSNIGIKLGLTSGIVGGKEVQNKTETDDDTTTNTNDYDASTFFIIPDISFVIRF